jgi:hypothetical protein
MSQKRKLRRGQQRFAVVPGGKATEADIALATPTHRFGMALDKFIKGYVQQHNGEVSPPEICRVLLELSAICALNLPGMHVDMEQWLMLCERVLDDQMKALGVSGASPSEEGA